MAVVYWYGIEYTENGQQKTRFFPTGASHSLPKFTYKSLNGTGQMMGWFYADSYAGAKENSYWWAKTGPVPAAGTAAAYHYEHTDRTVYPNRQVSIHNVGVVVAVPVEVADECTVQFVADSTSDITINGVPVGGKSIVHVGGFSVDVVAHPPAGKYASWSDGLETDAAIVRHVVWNANKTVSVSFVDCPTVTVAAASSTVGVNVDESCVATVDGVATKMLPAPGGATLSASVKTDSAIPLWSFHKWQDNDTHATRNVAVASDAEYTAYFKRDYFVLRLQLDGDAGDSAASANGDGLDEIAASGGLYVAVGEAVLLECATDPSCRLLGWYAGTVAEGNEISFAESASWTPGGDTTVVAAFAKTGVETAAVPPDAGFAYASATSLRMFQHYAKGDPVVVRAQSAKDGWTFIHWTDAEGGVVSTNGTYAFSMPQESVALKAVFHVDGVNVSVSVKVDGWSDDAVTLLTSCVGLVVFDSGKRRDVADIDRRRTGEVLWGQTAILSATEPDSEVNTSYGIPVHVAFSHWERKRGNEWARASADMDGYEIGSASPVRDDIEVRAVFVVREPRVVEFKVIDTLGNTVAGASLVPDREKHDTSDGYDRWLPGRLVVTPSGIPSGYHVCQWRFYVGAGGVAVDTKEEGQTGFSPLSYENVVPDNGCMFEAVVAHNQCRVAVSVDGPSAGHGTVKLYVDGTETESTEVTVTQGASIDVLATPASDGSAFRRFVDANGDELPAEQDETDASKWHFAAFDIVSDYTVVAVFGGTASASATPSSETKDGVAVQNTSTATVAVNGGTPAASCDYAYGDTLRLVATPGSGWHFVWWNGGGTTWTRDCEIVPETATVTAVAKFSLSAPDYYICLRHPSGVAGAGALRLSGGEDAAAEEMTESGFMAAVAQVLPSGTGSAASASSATGDDAPKYYRVSGYGNVLASFVPAIDSAVTFVGWRFVPYTAWSGTAPVESESPAALSSENPGAFVSPGHGVVEAVYASQAPKTVRLLRHSADAGASAGTVALSPAVPSRTASSDGTVSAVYAVGTRVVATAIPVNGYAFAGWFGSAGGDIPLTIGQTLEIVVPDTAGTVDRWAKFVPDTSALYAFDEGADNKTLVWRSMRFKADRPFNPSCCRVCADGEARLTVAMASSPDGGTADGWGTARQSVDADEAVDAVRQNPRRLLVMRPEKYLEIEVVSSSRVTMLAVATSMDALQ